LPVGGKTVFFHGKNRGGKNSFCRQKSGKQILPHKLSGMRQSVKIRLVGKNQKLECGPIPNVMAALPNIGGALCLTPQRLADAHY